MLIRKNRMDKLAAVLMGLIHHVQGTREDVSNPISVVETTATEHSGDRDDCSEWVLSREVHDVISHLSIGVIS